LGTNWWEESELGETNGSHGVWGVGGFSVSKEETALAGKETRAKGGLRGKRKADQASAVAPSNRPTEVREQMDQGIKKGVWGADFTRDLKETGKR